MDGTERDEPPSDVQMTAANLRHKLAITAAAVAATEDSLADTLDRMACFRPHAATRLRARALSARLFAAYERSKAASYGFYCMDVLTNSQDDESDAGGRLQ